MIGFGVGLKDIPIPSISSYQGMKIIITVQYSTPSIQNNLLNNIEFTVCYYAHYFATSIFSILDALYHSLLSVYQ